MKGFIEVTLENDKKCLINISNINEVWTESGSTMICTNNENASMYIESYEQVKELISKAIE